MTAGGELTGRALLVGLGVGAVLAIGNVYTGLKTNWWDSGNLTAAVVGFALLAPRARRGRLPYSPLENNVTQTAAGAVAIMPPALGLLGALPALELLGHRYPSWAIGLWGLALALFGILLAVPLRRRYVLADPLRFPSALATAELIRAIHASGREARKQTRALAGAAAVAMLVTWLRDGRPALIPAVLWPPLHLAGAAASAFTLGLAPSPMLLGAGVLAGPRTGLSMLGGSLLAWAVIAPALVRAGIAPAEYSALVSWLLWPGVALMVTTGVVALLRQWRSFARAVVDLARLGSAAGGEPARFWAALGGAAVLVVLLSWWVFHVPPWLGALAVLVSIVLIDVCVRTAGETDIAPVGALGQLLQLLLGLLGPGPAPINIACASVTAGAGVEAALSVNVLKAGHVLGATPALQLRVQAIGAVVGTLVALPAYALFKRAYQLGGPVLPAPGALGWKALGALAESGAGAMPRGTGAACAVAVALALVLALLEPTRAARFAPSPVALAVAFLVPATTGITVAAGALGLLVMPRTLRRPADAGEPIAASLAAGGIAGEALLSLVIALLMATGVLG